MPILIPVRGRLFVALLAAALLLAAGCSNDSGGDKTPAAGETPGAATAEITALAGTTFDTDELTIPAGAAVEITADITDGFHSFVVYESEAAAQNGEDPIAETESCSAPCKRTVEVNLSPGEHYFRCQVHPSRMNGVIVAE